MSYKNQHNEITLAQQCYEKLQKHIIEGDFLPRQKLKVSELKKQFDVGQSPVREALSRLVSTGLVETEDNKGFRVSPISQENIQDIYQTYLDIELLAITKAIEHGDISWESNIIRTLYELSTVETTKKLISYPEWAIKNYNFHLALIAGCNSPSLLQLRSTIYQQFDRYCHLSFKAHHKNQHLLTNHQEHIELAQATIARDTEKVKKIMTHHIMGSLKDVINLLKTNKIL